MAKKNLGDLIGGWAFLIGVILAVLVAVFPALQTVGMTTTLVILGVLIGFFNVADKETTPFLMSGLVLVLIGYVGTQAGDVLASVPLLGDILAALMTIFIPATVIVAVKNVFNLAKK